MPPVEGADPGMDEETIQEVVKGTDPAIYLLLAAVLIGFLYFLYTRKARADAEDEFFANLEDEKVSFSVFIRGGEGLRPVRSSLLTSDFTHSTVFFRIPCNSSNSSCQRRWTNTMPSKRSAKKLDGGLVR